MSDVEHLFMGLPVLYSLPTCKESNTDFAYIILSPGYLREFKFIYKFNVFFLFIYSTNICEVLTT